MIRFPHDSRAQTLLDHQQNPATRVRIRWWPALLILAVTAIALPAGLLSPRIAYFGQYWSLWRISVVGSGGLCLITWLVFLSGLPRKVRLAAAILFLVLVAGGAAAFRIEGVTGDLRPILGLRFGFSTAGGHHNGSAPIPIHLVSTPRDYPQFLGPHRDATLRDPRLDPDWNARPPRELWRRRVGEAWSAFAVMGDYAITQEQDGHHEQVVCYEARTGRAVWTFRYPAEFRTVVAGVGPRATPTIVRGRVYTMGATGILTCLDGSTGTKIWQRQTVKDAGTINREWGDSCSPLVIGDQVVVSGGGPNGWSLIAYHKDSGDVIWHGGDSYASYASPRLATLCGVQQILILNHLSVAAHDPNDGHVLWEHPFGAGEATVANPIPIGDDRVFLSAGYGYGCVLLKLQRTDSGAFHLSEAWPRNRNLKMKFTNGVVRDGHVYGLDDGVLACLELETGQRRWKAGRYGHGQVLLVDDILLVQGESGEVFLVRANPQRHEELARLAALSDKTWNNPALAGSLLFVRNDKEAACYEIPLAE